MQDVGKRLEHLLGLLEGEVDILQVEKRIRGRVKRQMERASAVLPGRAGQGDSEGLGEGDDNADLDEMEKKVKAAKMSKEAEAKAMTEIKLKMMSPCPPKRRSCGFIDTLLGLPWKKKSKINKDRERSQGPRRGRAGEGQGT
jgi:ATP-dependent Lon protease